MHIKLSNLSQVFWGYFSSNKAKISFIFPLALIAYLWFSTSFLVLPNVSSHFENTAQASNILTQPFEVAQDNSSQTDLINTNDFKNKEKTYLEKWSKFRGKLKVANIFIIFFVTLGPLKIIPAFIKLTQNADDSLKRNLAIKGAMLSTVIILLVVLIGGNILAKWTVSISSLLLASGILLFLASLQIVMSQYGTSRSNDSPPKPSMKLLVNPLIFPSILTPYGIALALILMVFNNRVSERPMIVPIVLIIIMILNLLAMLAARPILKTLTPATLQILGLVLGVMQLALGLELILGGIELEVLEIQDLLNSLIESYHVVG